LRLHVLLRRRDGIGRFAGLKIRRMCEALRPTTTISDTHNVIMASTARRPVSQRFLRARESQAGVTFAMVLRARVREQTGGRNCMTKKNCLCPFPVPKSTHPRQNVKYPGTEATLPLAALPLFAQSACADTEAAALRASPRHF
jgi:hypothetical protein